MLCDLIRLSRVGGIVAGKAIPCAKWRLRQLIKDEEIDDLSQRACRLINEARMHRLRTAGFQVRVVEYCESGLTPDNVVLLASRDFNAPLLKPMQVESSNLPKAGVLLEL